MMRCKDVAVLLSQEMDGEIPWSARLQLRTHLLLCRSCSRVRKQLRLLSDTARGIANPDNCPEDSPLPTLPTEARERMKKQIEEKS